MVPGSFPRIALSLMISLMAVARSSAADDATTNTLRLNDLFRAESLPLEMRRTNRNAPGGAVLVIPDTASWRLPDPTPTPEPNVVTMPLTDIPRLPQLIQKRDPKALFPKRTGLEEAGDTRGLPIEDRALLVFDSQTKTYMTEYRLHRLSDDGQEVGEPLVLRHGSGTREQITVPEGVIKLERTVWLSEAPADAVTETFRELRVRPRGRYVFTGRDL